MLYIAVKIYGNASKSHVDELYPLLVGSASLLVRERFHCYMNGNCAYKHENIEREYELNIINTFKR